MPDETFDEGDLVRSLKFPDMDKGKILRPYGDSGDGMYLVEWTMPGGTTTGAAHASLLARRSE